MLKRSVSQAVFDSPEALRVAREAHRLACEDLARMHPSQLGTGNPNHPLHDGIFGYETRAFMARQYAPCA